MRRILLFLMLLCTSVSANAAENEIKIGLSTGSQYNNNVGNVSSGNKRDAFSFDFGPTIAFDSSATVYELSAKYSPRVRIFTRDSKRDVVNVNHDLNLRSEYRPNERWTLGLSDAFHVQEDGDRDTNEGIQIDLDGSGDKQTLRNALRANVRYGATPRMSLFANGGYTIVSREDKDLSDSQQFSGSFRGNYAGGAKDTFGAGVAAQHQRLIIDNKNTTEKSSNDYYGFFLTWDHRFSPLTGVSAAGGPTWVVSEREGDRRINSEYFARMNVFTEYDKGSASISYQRSSSEFADTSTAYLIDMVTVKADWKASRKMVLAIKGGWNRRIAIRKFENSSFTFSNKVIQWQAAASVSYQLTRELMSSLTVDYLNQNLSEDSGSVDRFLATIRFHYNARAYRF